MKETQEDRRQPILSPAPAGEEASREAVGAELRAVLDALPGAALLWDEEGVLRAANRAAGAMVGRSREELAGVPRAEWEALLARHYAPAPSMPAAAAGGDRIQSTGFPRMVFERESQPLPAEEGSPGGRLELLRNVTADLRAEQNSGRETERHARELAALSAQLEQAEKFKMELTANVTHDLRTPLASIKASVSGLLAGDVAYEPQALRETLSLIEDETDRLQRRVQNLLSMASMESGTPVMNRDWVDIPDVVASALESLRSVRGDREVRRQFPEELPLVLADYDQLQIAIRNLIENAFLYAPPGTPIEVSAGLGLGQVRVRVRDFGPGLMPDEAERIFDKFYRGRAARRIPGTGLGLPICRGIAEAHHGSLWAEHDPGGGVAFVFSLPLSQEPELSEP